MATYYTAGSGTQYNSYSNTSVYSNDTGVCLPLGMDAGTTLNIDAGNVLLSYYSLFYDGQQENISLSGANNITHNVSAMSSVRLKALFGECKLHL